MKIAIRKEQDGSIYIDKTALQRFDEETLKHPPYNYKFIEVDEKYSDFENSDFNDDLTFSIEKYNARKQKERDVVRLEELINWFDNYFDKQLTQSQWQDDFKVSKDPYFKDVNGQPKTYANIDELKAQAKLVREEIKKLRQN